MSGLICGLNNTTVFTNKTQWMNSLAGELVDKQAGYAMSTQRQGSHLEEGFIRAKDLPMQLVANTTKLFMKTFQPTQIELNKVNRALKILENSVSGSFCSKLYNLLRFKTYRSDREIIQGLISTVSVKIESFGKQKVD